MGQVADGVIVGSALVDRLSRGTLGDLTDLVRELADGVRSRA